MEGPDTETAPTAALLDRCSEGVLVLDDDRIAYANDAARRLLGAESPVGDPVTAHPPFAPASDDDGGGRDDDAGAADRTSPDVLDRYRAAVEANSPESFEIHRGDTTYGVTIRPGGDGPPSIHLRDVSDRARTDREFDRHRTAIRDLHRTTADPDADFEQKARRLLTVAADRLGVSDAVLAAVDPDRDRYEVLATGEDPTFAEEGTVLSLSDLYCRRTVDDEELMTVEDPPAEGLADHPAYREHGVACYMGSRLVVDGDLFGVVCLFDREERRPFTDSERSFVELLVEWIESELERDRRQRELRRYERIVQTVDDGIYALDEDRRYALVNDAALAMTGYDREELIGAHASVLTDEETTDWADVTQDGGGVLETEIVTKGGDRLPVENRFTPFPPGGDGRVGIFRDLTDRRQFERRLRRLQRTTERMARAESVEEVCSVAVEAATEIVGTSMAAVYRVDREVDAEGDTDADGEDGPGRLVPVVGDAAVSSFTDRHDLDLPPIGGPDADGWRAYADGETTVAEPPDSIPNQIPDGADADAEGWASGLAGFDSVVFVPVGEFGVVAAAADDHLSAHALDLLELLASTTAAAVERARREETLRTTRERLERSNDQLERFAYVASHDLREPLRMVSSYLQLLERRYGDDLDEEAREFLDYAVDGADRMKSMIESLLAVARVDTRGGSFEPTDTTAALDRALANLRVAVEEAGATVTAGDLPTVSGDPEQLVQLFQNLVGNALEHADDAPTVRVSATDRGGYYEFAVADDGVGMDPEDAERAFGMFERLGDRDEAGTGIGLAVCERIVDRHGGEIRIDAELGEGTTVRFTLPAPGTEEAGAVQAGDSERP